MKTLTLQSQNIKLSWVFITAVVIYILHTALPILGYYMPATINIVILAFLYIWIFVKWGNKIALKTMWDILPIVAIPLLGLFYINQSNWDTYIYGELQLFIYPLLSLFLLQNATSKIAKRILFVTALAYLVTSLTTYFGCRMFPMASRELAAMLNSVDNERYALYMSYNIGSFSFIYTLVLIFPLNIYIIRNRQINLILGIIFLYVTTIAIYQTEYTTALLFLISSFFLFFLPKNFRPRYLWSFFVTIILVLFLSETLFSTFLNELSSRVQSEIVSTRLSDLSFFWEGSNTGQYNDLDSRIVFYNKSLDAFLNHPLIGSPSDAGGHSYILDNLAQWGIIGLIAMIFMYRTIYTYFVKPFKNQSFYGYILYVFVLALVLAILNPKDNIIVLTLIVPLFVKAFERK